MEAADLLRHIYIAGELVICHHCWAVGQNLIKDNTGVHTLEMTSGKYLMRVLSGYGTQTSLMIIHFV